MANFVSRNVLICVVPAVVLLLSVYWFRKKKKMKPDIISPANKSTVSVTKNYISDSHGNSMYSSVDCSSDFSNTLSDASSMSSPENSVRTQSISGETSSENIIDDCIEAVAVPNHISKLSYDVAKEGNLVYNRKSQTQNGEECENVILENDLKQFNVVDCEKNETTNHNLLDNKIANSLEKVNTSVNDALGENKSETIKSNNDNLTFSASLHSNDTNCHVELKEQEKKSDASENALNDVEDPVIAVKQNSFSSELIKQLDSKPSRNSNIALESYSPDSHSSVLDENSLSSVSDESDRQIDFKYKDSPSSVFDGNSISDESDKTDISNENANHSKSDENTKNTNYVYNNINSTSCADSTKDEHYSIKLNKNSFLKTILSADTTTSEASSSGFVENSPSSQHSYSLLPSSLQSFSSEDSFLCVSKDYLGTVDQQNNQPMQLNKDLVSSEDNNCNSSVETSLTSEILSLDSENVISSTSPDKYNQIEAQSRVTDTNCGDVVVSSSDEVINKNVKMNGEQLNFTSSVETDTETVKYQDAQLEQNQNKVADLDVVDMKSSGAVPGLFVYEFDLPQELCGRLIGKQGKHVKSIKERTNANVFIKRHPFDSNLKTVVVEGSRTSVYEALEIIRRKFPPAQFPAVTLIQTNMISSHGVPLPESLQWSRLYFSYLLPSPTSYLFNSCVVNFAELLSICVTQLHLPEGASCDVILSSLVSAGHFFLQQPTHPTYPSLGTLDQCMISCYTQMDTPLLPQPVEAGVICAAPVMNGWFRAQIVYVYENRTECEIKFVDYGGFSQVSMSSLRQIRSDFMTLPFQASECYLANVRPVDRSSNWSSEATSVFEELAQGQILQALLVEYADDGIPCVHLYRVQGVSNMFINRELVERGLAVWVDNSHWDPH